MDSIYWALLLSFIAGACAYIVVRFWIIPIVRYRRIKRELIKILRDYVSKWPSNGGKDPKGPPGKKQLRDMRQMSKRLFEFYELELPHWYKLVLMTRNESPKSASESLQRFEKITGASEARQCLSEIGRHLATVLIAS